MGEIWIKRDRCKVCRRKNVKVYDSGMCLDCAINKVAAVNKQLAAKKGYWYRKWRAGIKRSLRIR